MSGFSYGKALGAGFRVIGRKPLAVAIWAAVYLVFAILPAIALLAHVLPSVIAAHQDAALHGLRAGRPDPAAMLALRSRAFGWQPALWLLQMATHTVVMAAIFRAVLEPQNDRWGYLRLSRQELWLGLTLLVIMVMSVIMVFILAIPLAIGGAVMAAMSAHGGGSVGGALLLTLIGLAGGGAIVWVLLRLSLALPMSFAEGRFLLYESWDLTRGQAFKMFLVYLLLVIGLVLLECVAVAVAGVTLIPQLRGVAGTGHAHVEAVLRLIHRHAWVVAGLAVAVSAIAAAIRTIMIAPLAQIYRELAAEAPAAT